MRLMTVFGAAAMAFAVPAAACYTGPMPVAFAGKSSRLTAEARRNIEIYAQDRGLNGNDRLMVIFYGGRPKLRADLVLRRDRALAILAYLRTQGVPSQKIDLVTTKKPMESWLIAMDKGPKPVATVELAVGCN